MLSFAHAVRTKPTPSLLLVVLAAGLAGCASHDLYSFSFRKAELTLGDRGIAIPVPPPSLRDAPVQESEVTVDVDYILDEPAQPPQDTEAAVELWVRDRVGGAVASALAPAPPPGTVTVEGLVLDHTRNCLELWLEVDGGARSEVTVVHTVIDDDDVSVRVEPGCEVGGS